MIVIASAGATAIGDSVKKSIRASYSVSQVGMAPFISNVAAADSPAPRRTIVYDHEVGR